jgi:hypothetical protein
LRKCTPICPSFCVKLLSIIARKCEVVQGSGLFGPRPAQKG